MKPIHLPDRWHELLKRTGSDYGLTLREALLAAVKQWLQINAENHAYRDTVSADRKKEEKS